tara:strand:- start:5 stop:583 length:579 start_codon:yes stop_codon:yes gene_type:complete
MSNSNIDSIDTIYTIDEKIDIIIDLYKSSGDENYYGEVCSKTSHMIQCALVAQSMNLENYIVLACLLHDIGHFLEEDNTNGYGVADHGKIGANFLRELEMDERVCYLVEKHIEAKRYLISTQISYYNNLSEASKETLKCQGGRMKQEEITDFEQDEYYEEILLVRKCDDMGKENDKTLPKIEDFKLLISQFL